MKSEILYCRRCNKALTGHRRKWCSIKCQNAGRYYANLEKSREYHREIARKRYSDPSIRALYTDRERKRRENKEYIDRKYGLPKGTTLKLLKNGKCEICGDVERLVIDHNHETEVVRGVLCNNCNTGLGMFADDPLRLTSAIVYLQNHKEKKNGTN